MSKSRPKSGAELNSTRREVDGRGAIQILHVSGATAEIASAVPVRVRLDLLAPFQEGEALPYARDGPHFEGLRGRIEAGIARLIKAHGVGVAAPGQDPKRAPAGQGDDPTAVLL